MSEVWSFDTETHLITDENPTPTLVCGSFASRTREPTVLGGSNAGKASLGEWLRNRLQSRDIIVCHNAKFDMLVSMRAFPHLSGLIFKAYEEGRIRCTAIREKLIHNSIGRLTPKKGFYSLADCLKRHKLESFSEEEKGEDAWRMRYAELDGKPVSEWPLDAIRYPQKDAELTLKLYLAQIGEAERRMCPLADQTLQYASDFCLGLITERGIFTDKERVETLETELTEQAEEFAVQLLEQRLARIKVIHRGKPHERREFKKENKALQQRILEHYPKARRTKKNTVRTDADTLEMLPVEVPGVDAWRGYMKLEKQIGTFIPAVSKGIGETPVRPNFDVLKSTGRCSSSGPNLQQVPRKGGFRECFRARDGFVFVNCDYDSQEMRMWAEVTTQLFGESRLASYYIENPAFDPHSLFASEVFLKCSYEECLERVAADDPEARSCRQRSKAANFGYPGGLGADSFVAYARGYGVDLSLRESKAIRDNWLRTWPEANKYLRWANRMSKKGRIEQLWSGRLRGRCGYTQIANSMFQGLAGDATKLALFNVTLECQKGGRLEGSHVVLVIHDEVMLESPELCAEEHAEILAEIMVAAQETVAPTIPARAGYNINKYWSK